MANKADFSGMSPDKLREQGRQALENELNESKKTKAKESGDEQPQSKQPENSATTEASSTQSNEQAGEDALNKYDNVLMNTFGFEEGEITDKDRKLAKSWSQIQSTATKAKQQASQSQQIVDQLNQTLEKYPSLYNKLQQAVQGQYNEEENPTQNQEPKNSGQSDVSTGQLDNISEQQLVQQGYLNESDLEGLDDISRQRKVFQAETRYIRDQERERYRNEIKKEQEDLRNQQELQQVKKENKRRFDKGFDDFVTKYGVNFAELDDSVINQIQKRVAYTLDPNDPRKIAEDAFEVVASRVLQSNGIDLNQPVQTGKNNLSGIEDTGKSFTKSSQSSQKKKSVSEQLSERARQRFARSNDPKSKYRQQAS